MKIFLSAAGASIAREGNKITILGIQHSMPYASGEIPEIGDRISDDKRSRVGTVTHISVGPRNPTELTIRWDDGVVGIRYPAAEDFTLIFRAPEQE